MNDESTANDGFSDDEPQPCMLLPGHLADGAIVGGPPGEPVVEVRVLGSALGQARPLNSFHELVREGVLEPDVHYFEFRPESGQNPLGGRPRKFYYLTEVGAVLFTMRARTPLARQMQRQIAHVFVEWRHGKGVGAATSGVVELVRMVQSLIARQAERDRKQDAFNESVNGRVGFLESHVARGGEISTAEWEALRLMIGEIIALECAVRPVGKGSIRREIYNELEDRTAWRGKGSTWRNLPIGLLPGVMKYLRGRRAAAVKDLGLRARSQQVGFDFPDDPKKAKH